MSKPFPYGRKKINSWQLYKNFGLLLLVFGLTERRSKEKIKKARVPQEHQRLSEYTELKPKNTWIALWQMDTHTEEEEGAWEHISG